MSINSILSRGMTIINPNKIKKSYYKSMNRRDQKTCFVNVECPTCSSSFAYITWQKNYSVGFCPDCDEEWLEP